MRLRTPSSAKRPTFSEKRVFCCSNGQNLKKILLKILRFMDLGENQVKKKWKSPRYASKNYINCHGIVKRSSPHHYLDSAKPWTPFFYSINLHFVCVNTRAVSNSELSETSGFHCKAAVLLLKWAKSSGNFVKNLKIDGSWRELTNEVKKNENHQGMLPKITSIVTESLNGAHQTTIWTA